MSHHLALGAIAVLGGLAMLDTRRGSRSGGLWDRRFGAVTPRARELFQQPGLLDEVYLEDLDWNLGVVERIYPAARRRYPQETFDLRQSPTANAWYLPGSPGTIRLSEHYGAPGFISHQSMHMLDNDGNRWLSGVSGTPAHKLTMRANELVTPHLNAYIDAQMNAAILDVHSSVRYLLRPEVPVSWDTVHEALVDGVGSKVTPAEISMALKAANVGFGYFLQPAWKALGEGSALVAELKKLTSMLPRAGIPLSLINKPKEALDLYLYSYDAKRLRQDYRSYLFAPYEIFARLMDQVAREKALRDGTPIRRKERVRLDDVPLTLLPEIENQAWAAAHQMGWTR